MAEGRWYWVSKAVIQEYTKRVGFLAMGVYHLLASMADDRQSCYPSQKYIGEKLGCARASAGKAIKKLATAGLIAIDRRTRYHCVYRLLAARCQRDKPEMSPGRTSDAKDEDTNNIQRKRLKNNTATIDSGLTKDGEDSDRPTGKRGLLATDLAEGLEDRAHYSFYLTCARKYPESFLREILSTVRQTPAERIKKSRSAFFRFLLRRYAR